MRGVRVASLVSLCLVLFAAGAVAAQAKPSTGVIDATASTQDRSVRLPGVVITVYAASGTQVGQQIADGEGRAVFPGLQPGTYRVTASLESFRTADQTTTVSAGATMTIVLDLPIADLSETVEVVARAPIDPASDADTVAPADSMSDRERDEYAPGGGFQAALRLLASAIQVPNGLSIKGGRPNQAGVQLGPGTVIDPSTGEVHLTLPADAVDTVSVLPNPYAVEFGRFSSGLVVIQTRRGTNQWRLRLNDIDPSFRTRRYHDLDIVGLQEFAPRVEFGGPLLKDRVFLEQTGQFRYLATDVPSRPETELRVDKWFSSFTRVDATLSPRHSLVASGGLFPSSSTYATLGTFLPPNATVNLSNAVAHASASERAIWTDSVLSETTVRTQEYRTAATPQGSAPMELRPETTAGNFFNRQDRTTGITQLVETVSAAHDLPGGHHLMKFGLDLLHSRYDGTSLSQPLLIERTDGTLVRRLDFMPFSVQSVRSTDLALFAQDRIQRSARWYVEFGGRLDRDGVLDHWNVTPRAGLAVVLDRTGNIVIRGGYGLFYERTPSAAGAFGEFGGYTDTRYDANGSTTSSQFFAHAMAPDLKTSRSATWNVDYDHRLNRNVAFHAGLLDRRGADELIVNPVVSATSAALLLSSTGRSEYRDVEVGMHVTGGRGLDVNATYVHSSSRGDLNAFSNYFGAVLSPVVGVDAYGPTATEVPNRLLVRGRVMPTDRWLLVGVLDWRNGFPYSTVNDTLDFVGARNAYRFPTVVRLEVGAERRMHVLKWNPWVGVRVLNPLNAYWPTDVQSNVSSPAFGSFYNSDYRRIRIIIRFQR